MDKQEKSRVRGALGEIRAEQILVGEGYSILERNYRVRGAEIDLIAEEGRCIAFVEVKLRTSGASGREAVTKAKQRRICAGALRYLAEHGLMNRQARFDVLELQGERWTLIRDAFPYQGGAF